jgi:uncharacterized repeat protein (TIGR01451 family)
MIKTVKLLALFCVVLVQSASAQFVTIPDVNFRNALKIKYPTCFNASNQLDTVCAGNATNTLLNVSFKQIANLEGVRYFKKLTRLHCDSNQLTSLPTLPNGLTRLYCAFNQLTSLPTLPSGLTGLNCHKNQLTSLSTLPSGLTGLNCWNNQLTSLPTLPSGLLGIWCHNNQLTSLPTLPSGLTSLNCGGNQLTSLPTLPSELILFWCHNNQLTSLPTLPSGLIELWSFTNQLTSLPTLPSGLTDLLCHNNQLTDLPALPSGLIELWCSDNQLTDLPALSSGLTSLHCDANPQLSCLPFLPQNMNSLIIDGTNITCLPNKPIGLDSAFMFFPICNVTNNVNACNVYPRLQGYVFHDANNNGVKDAGETPRVGVKVHIPNKGFAGYTNENGFYEITVDSLKTYTASIAQVPVYYTSASPSQSVTFTVYGETIERNFPLQTTQTVKDFRVYLTNLNAFARPGFGLILHLGYQNKGTVPANAVIKFAKADLYNVSATSLAHTLIGDTLVWTIPNVQAGQFGYIQIQGTLSASAPLGSIQNFYASVNQNDVEDNVIADNRSNLALEVRGSYDPNDKQGTRTLTPTQVANGEFIDYTIRFQNTGTDTAFTVVIADTLANNLQANTLEIITASHSVNTELKGNIIYFKFNNILLPDSNINEPRSHGFVSFRIKPKTNLVLGNTIQNKAAIYFDFNAPIITNTVVTTVAIPTGIAEKITNRLEVFPNPLEGEMLTIPNMRGASAKLLALTGQELRSWTNISEQISLQNVAAGMYLLEVSQNGQRRTAKVVVK